MIRADVLIALRGHCASRTLAAKLIKEGRVFADGVKVTKPSLELKEFCLIEIKDSPLTRYVSRGGLKLEAALDFFGIDPAGKICADIGAATGGFTDCLIKRGAKKVFAVDVGTAQLHPSLRFDRRVVCMENTDARSLSPSSFDPAPTLLVSDLSFISQTLLHETFFSLLPSGGELVTLIKPQFEAGRQALGKNGVVKSDADVTRAVDRVTLSAISHGFELVGTVPSPVPGGDGNRELLMYCRKR